MGSTDNNYVWKYQWWIQRPAPLENPYGQTFLNFMLSFSMWFFFLFLFFCLFFFCKILCWHPQGSPPLPIRYPANYQIIYQRKWYIQDANAILAI